VKWWLAGLAAWLAFAHVVLAADGQRAGQLPTLPLTQLDERAGSADLDRPFSRTFAEPVPVRDVLLALVQGTNLSVVPDPEIAGTFTGELKNVTVRQALDSILAPLGLDYTVDGTMIRVSRRARDTRIYDLNFIAAERAGAATVGTSEGPSSASVSTATKADVFADIAAGLRSIVSERAVFNLDRKAGLLQVTDLPERLDRIAAYLDAVHDRVHRQAQIDARVIEVELTDEKARGIDWTAASAQAVRPADGQPATPRPAGRASLTGLRVTDVGRLLAALEAQGTVTVLGSPRLLTLNNEPAIIRTDAITLSVTAQIAGDAVLTLSLAPVVNAPAVAESSMLARVADGETLVVSGFTQARETRERKAVGISGGWFGRRTVVTRRQVELVILLTPRIVSGVAAQ
jgi:MSHA biogenesis protein MshL